MTKKKSCPRQSDNIIKYKYGLFDWKAYVNLLILKGPAESEDTVAVFV